MPQSHYPSHDAARPTPPARPPAAAPIAPAVPDAVPFYESPTWTWPEFDPECCQECGRTIPLHETGYILGEDILCEECHDILSALRTSRLKLLRQAAMVQRPVSQPVTTQPPTIEAAPQPATPTTNSEPAPPVIEVIASSVHQSASIVEDESPLPAPPASTFQLTGSFIWRNHFAADVAALLTEDPGITNTAQGAPLFDEPLFELTSAPFFHRACFGDEPAAGQDDDHAATAAGIDDSMPLFDEPPFELTAAPFEPRTCFADGLPHALSAAMCGPAALEDHHDNRPPADDGVTLFDEPPFELEPAAFQWRPHFADSLPATENKPAAADDPLTTTATDDGLTLFDEPPFELEPAPFEYRAHFAHELAASIDAPLATTATDDGVTLFDEPPFELEPAPFVPRAAFATVAVEEAPPPAASPADAGTPLLDWRDDQVDAAPAPVKAEVEIEAPVEVAPVEVETPVEVEAPVEAQQPVQDIAAVESDLNAPVDAVHIDVDSSLVADLESSVGAEVETSVVADVVVNIEPVVDVVDIAAIYVASQVPTDTPDEVPIIVTDQVIDTPVVTATDSGSDEAGDVDAPTAAVQTVDIADIVETPEIVEIVQTPEIVESVLTPEIVEIADVADVEVAQTDAFDTMELHDEEVVAEIDDLPPEDVAPTIGPVPVPAAPVEPAPLVPTSIVETPIEQASVEQASVEQASIEQASVEQASIEQASVEQASIEQASVEQPPPTAAAPPPAKSSESIMPIIDSALADAVKPIFRDKPARPSHPSLGAQTPETPPPPARLKARSRRRPKPAQPPSRPPADSPLSFKHPVDALLDKLHAEQIDAGVWQTLNQWRAKDRFFADVAAMLDVADDLLGDWMARRESQDKGRKSTG